SSDVCSSDLRFDLQMRGQLTFFLQGQYLQNIRLRRLQGTQVFEENRDVKMCAPFGGIRVEQRVLRIGQILVANKLASMLLRDDLMQVDRLIEIHKGFP